MSHAVSCPRPDARLRARALLWWLVLAMLLAPALGRIHQVLHPPAWNQTQWQPGVAVQGDAGAGRAVPWLLALFSGHGHGDCQLHDQLNAWASPPAAGPSLPAALPQQPPRQVEGRTASAGSAAFFDPRAPPAVA